MANRKVTPQKNVDPARNRFAFRFLAAGAIAPGVLFTIGHLFGGWIREGYLSMFWRAAWWVLWPSWVLLFDAEHTPQIVFGMLVGAVLNAVYYYIVGFLVWDFREWVSKQ